MFLLVCVCATNVRPAQWAMTPEYRTAAEVWATALNEGGWPTQGLSYCVGFLGNVATFVGADASVHLAEEVENAAKNIPRAILGAMLINGAVGFIMMVGLSRIERYHGSLNLFSRSRSCTALATSTEY